MQSQYAHFAPSFSEVKQIVLVHLRRVLRFSSTPQTQPKGTSNAARKRSSADTPAGTRAFQARDSAAQRAVLPRKARRDRQYQSKGRNTG